MNHEVGKKVYIQGSYNLLAGTVVKITPTGFVDVKYDHCDRIMRFNSQGKEVGGNFYRCSYLLTDEKATESLAWEEKKAALQKVTAALSKVAVDLQVNYRWEVDGLQKEVERLQGLLDTAKQLLSEVGGAR